MPATPRSLLRARTVTLLGVCLLVLSALPSGAAQAAYKQSTIDNSAADFGRGAFQRSALSNLQNTGASPKLPDQPGAVQLGPIGILRNWVETSFNLKKSLIRMGATSLGNRIYVIGGSTPSGSAQLPVADVWSASVSQVTGQFIDSDWQAEPSLPAIKSSNQTAFVAPIAPISAPAVASVSTGGNAGYIYVIGGNALSGVIDFSSYAVRIGVAGSDGRITSWIAGPPISSPDADDVDNTNQFGVQSAMAQSFTVGGSTYIYVIGGLRRYRSGGGGGTTISEGSKAVYYARVGAGGQLFNPKTGAQGWGLLNQIPSPGDSPAGIWDGVAMADSFPVSTGMTHSALYVTGGQLTPDPSPTYNETVYRAFINNDGTLNWDPAVWQGVLPQVRTGLSGVTFRGTLYAVGGIPSNGSNPDKGVLTSYVEDDLTLHQFGSTNLPPGVDGGGSNFLKSDALPRARTYQGVALVKANGSSTNSAFVYVLGGRGDTSQNDSDKSDDNGSATVFYGKIGGSEEVASTGYASDAWYYSKPFDINFTGAQLQEISWATQIDRSAATPDIQIDYRVSLANNCANADWTDNSWVTLDGSTTDAFNSVNGANSATVPNLAARCFQYRSKLTTTDYHVTPSLLNLSIRIYIPGNPDLTVSAVTPLGSSRVFTGLTVTIKNDGANPGPTLAADVDGGGEFFVDLCVFGPNDTATPQPPTLPMADDKKQCSKVYATVNKSTMGAGITYQLTQWRSTADDQPKDILTLFQTPGKYTVYAAVDSYNYVNEGTDGGENNNVSAATTFTVEKVGRLVYLPQAKTK